MKLRERIIEYVMKRLEKLIERAEGYKETESQFSTDLYRDGMRIVRVSKTQGEWLHEEEWKRSHVTYVA